MFVLLTDHNDKCVLVNMSMIYTAYESGGGTALYPLDGYSNNNIVVKETPAEIMAKIEEARK